MAPTKRVRATIIQTRRQQQLQLQQQQQQRQQQEQLNVNSTNDEATKTRKQTQLSPATSESTTTATIEASVAAASRRSDVVAKELPHVCRCCSKANMEMISIFEAAANDEEPQQQINQNGVKVKEEEESSSSVSSQSPQSGSTTFTQPRSIDNPVDYALSGAHASNDIVLEEMRIWMLNIKPDDGLPQQICKQCKAQFLMVAKFRRRCQRVQQRLRDVAQAQLEQANKLEDPENIEQNTEELQQDNAKEELSTMIAKSKRFKKNTSATMDTPLKGNADIQVGDLPPENLMQTPIVPVDANLMELPSAAAQKASQEGEATATPSRTVKRRKAEKQTVIKTDIEAELLEPPQKIRCENLQSSSPPQPKTDKNKNEKEEQMVDGLQKLPAVEEISKDDLQRGPWKTKAARKEINETSTSSASSPASSLEQQSDFSVEDCPGFINPSEPIIKTSSSSDSDPGKFPPKKRAQLPVCNTVERTRRKCLATARSSSVKRARTRVVIKRKLPRQALARKVKADKSSAPQLQFEELTSSTETATEEQASEQEEQRYSVTPEVPSPVCEIEVGQTNGEEDLEQALVSSTHEQVQSTEIIVRIPLHSLSNDLITRLGNVVETSDDDMQTDNDSDVTKTPTESEEVNNNENNENFCQSATADSFNSAAALNEHKIEANTTDKKHSPTKEIEKVDAAELQVAETPPDIQTPRCAQDKDLPNNDAHDFFAEFEKHCEKSLDALDEENKNAALPTLLPEPADEELSSTNPVEAKRLLEVEMNDVEITLNGILNEMQDQHLYTPVCPHVDEFLSPADYTPLTEQETPSVPLPHAATVSSDQQLFDGDFNNYEAFPPVHAGNAANGMIGFQNDIPCFENIDVGTGTDESIEASLQEELTQLLNELQPTQTTTSAAQVEQQQQQQVPQPTLYQAVEQLAAEQLIQTQPASAANNTERYTLYQAPADNNGKLQLISLPQEQQLNLYAAPQQSQLLAQQQTTQLQWSAVGGLEAIKTTENNSSSVDNLTPTTTYYIDASDLYQPQQALTQQQLENCSNHQLTSYTMLQSQPQAITSPHLDSNDNYLEQHGNNNQPIMILIQQPEMAQPVASASNPHQPPLQMFGAPISNELHVQQLQQQQRQLQHQQQLKQVQNRTVLNMQQQQQHADNNNRRVVTLKCRFCHNGPRFSNSLEYSKHIIELHPAIAPFNCPHCPMTFTGRNKRSQHILTHHFVQHFQCGQCTQVFPAQRALDLHLQRFHALGEKQNARPSQQQGVRIEDVKLQITEQSQDEASTSMTTTTGTTSTPRKTRILCCPDCEDGSSTDGHHHEKYEDLGTLQPPPVVLTPPSTIGSLPSPQPIYSPHITMPSPEQSEPDSTTTLRQFRKRRSSPCTASLSSLAKPQINSPSPSSSPSSSTMESVTALRGSHHCIYCEERFTNDIALRKHQQLAHGSLTTMPFVCSICKRGYRMRTALHRHMETHDAEGRPYECNVCRVRFPRPSQLTLHKITVHLLSKPHTCDECGKQFGTESALKTHIKFHGAHMNTHLPLGVYLNENAALPKLKPASKQIAAALPAASRKDAAEDTTQSPPSNEGTQNAATTLLENVESNAGLQLVAATQP